MSLLQDAQRITEYRIPKEKAEVQNDEDHYILRVEDEEILGEEHEAEELPDKVKCSECRKRTAEQVDDDQLFKCTECGRETVRTQ